MLLTGLFSVLVSIPSANAQERNPDFPNPCPQVSGNYQCTGGKADKIKVRREIQNGFVNIALTGKIMITENQTLSFQVDETSHRIVIDGGAAIGFVADMVNSCSDSVLNSKVYFQNRQGEPKKLFTEINISAPSKKEMQIEATDFQGATVVMNCRKSIF